MNGLHAGERDKCPMGRRVPVEENQKEYLVQGRLETQIFNVRTRIFVDIHLEEVGSNLLIRFQGGQLKGHPDAVAIE